MSEQAEVIVSEPAAQLCQRCAKAIVNTPNNSIRAAQCRYRESHRDLCRERARTYYNDHKDTIKARRKQLRAQDSSLVT